MNGNEPLDDLRRIMETPAGWSRYRIIPNDPHKRVWSTERTGDPDVPFVLLPGTEAVRNGRTYYLTPDKGGRNSARQKPWGFLAAIVQLQNIKPSLPLFCPSLDTNDSPMNTFYVLWNPASDIPPSKQFPSLDEARRVAEIMAVKHPGETFHVMKTLGCVKKDGLSWNFPANEPS